MPLFGLAVFTIMVCRLTPIQTILTENRATRANTILARVEILATGHSTGTIQAGNGFRYKFFRSHDLAYLSQLFLNALAVRLNRTPPADAFPGISHGEGYFNSDCLLHSFYLL
jgi:hypothetical protein